MDYEIIYKNAQELLSEVPKEVTVVLAAKGRSAKEVEAAIDAGIRIVGHNYVKEAEAHKALLPHIEFHLIGHLQTNKAKKAIDIFNMIQTLDSIKLALELQKQCQIKNITKDVLIEINSGREAQKAGVLPEDLKGFLTELRDFDRIHVRGLMTMGPYLKDPEEIRPYFRLTKELFWDLRTENLPNVDMEILSMGMSDSYKIAIQEGANMVRIGTKIFGPRTNYGIH